MGKPFYMQLDFFGPHQPFAIPGGWEEREEEIRRTVQLPESWLEWEAAGFPSETDDPRVYDLYRKNWGLKDRTDLEDYLVANQLQYEILDRQLGHLLDYLKSQKLYDDTMIIFTCDHGEMNGCKGCIDKGAYLNPQVLQVPLYMKLPKGNKSVPSGMINDQSCSLLDIFPTICDLTGLSVDARTDGFSLLRTAAGEKRPEDQPVMFDVWNHVVPNPTVGLVFKEKEKHYIYSYNTTCDKDELYDLDDEPGKIDNVIGTDQDLDLSVRRAMFKALSGDVRWDVYNCYFKLEYADKLGLKPGDNQKFE